MITIRHVKADDKLFWYQLDKHLPEAEFENKVNTKRGYILLENEIPAGLLRYNLFGTIYRFVRWFISIYRFKGTVMGKCLWSTGKMI